MENRKKVTKSVAFWALSFGLSPYPSPQDLKKDSFLVLKYVNTNSTK